MRISVILPCYNGAATLAVQLEALTRQTYRGEWELVFADNGSTDGSLALLDGFRPRLPSTRVVQVYDPARGRRGVAFSYAFAMAASDADAFVLCEADDEVADDWLDHMARALERHDLVAAAIDYDKLNPGDLMQGPGQQSRERGLPRNSGPLHLPYASGCALGLRRSVIDRIGPPSEEMGPSWDLDYCWEAQRAGIELTFVPDAVVHYRLRDSVRGRYRQAQAWGRSHVGLHLKYAQFRVVNQVLGAGARLGRSVLRLGEVALGRRSFRQWVWDFGWAMGRLQGVAQRLRSGDKPSLTRGISGLPPLHQGVKPVKVLRDAGEHRSVL